jgi:arsenate reductase (glutaredoxin)
LQARNLKGKERAIMKATIWHNPDCGTSRNVLAILQEAGAELRIIDYRQTGFDRAQLAGIIADAGLSPRQALRTRGSPAAELGLLDGVDADGILDAMVEHPILVERPFVTTDKGTRLCRPPEKVREIL